MDFPLEDEFAGGKPTCLGAGYHILKGSVVCLEEVCLTDNGIRNQIFYNLYVGVPNSNCHPKRCPFGATTVCITILQ